MMKKTTFSLDRKYRYTLWRNWGGMFEPEEYVMFIGLNPSTADEVKNDPTVRRCIGYAKDWGYTAICMTNIFAYRATLPGDMMAVSDPVGPQNDSALVEVAQDACIVIAAWGVNGSYLNRGEEVQKLLPNLHYLKLTKEGFPAHPLYLPKNLKPKEWL